MKTDSGEIEGENIQRGIIEEKLWSWREREENHKKKFERDENIKEGEAEEEKNMKVCMYERKREIQPPFSKPFV